MKKNMFSLILCLITYAGLYSQDVFRHNTASFDILISHYQPDYFRLLQPGFSVNYEHAWLPSWATRLSYSYDLSDRIDISLAQKWYYRSRGIGGGYLGWELGLHNLWTFDTKIKTGLIVGLAGLTDTCPNLLTDLYLSISCLAGETTEWQIRAGLGLGIAWK